MASHPEDEWVCEAHFPQKIKVVAPLVTERSAAGPRDASLVMPIKYTCTASDVCWKVALTQKAKMVTISAIEAKQISHRRFIGVSALCNRGRTIKTTAEC